MSRTKSPVSVTIKRYEVIIAVVTLVGALAASLTSLIIQYRQSQRLDLLQVTIRDTNELRDSLRKPLEGVWDYKLEFSKYFRQDTAYISAGKAIFIWRSASNDYAVYIGYGIKQQWETDEVVTGFLIGTLRANRDGWPAEPFEMPMRYEHRTGKDNFQRVSKDTFTFLKGSAKPDAAKNQAIGITMDFDTPTTVGKVTMWR